MAGRLDRAPCSTMSCCRQQADLCRTRTYRRYRILHTKYHQPNSPKAALGMFQ